MAIRSSETVTVGSSPQETLEFVLDLEAYRKVDPKIRKVVRAAVVDAAGAGTARIIGGLWHFPPAPDTHLVRLEPWRRLTFVGAPLVFARAIYSFTGTFEAAETDAGTELTHSYDITFRQPLAGLFGPRVQRWLDADLTDEMARLRAALGPPA